jgi:hypothetical protein
MWNKNWQPILDYEKEGLPNLAESNGGILAIYIKIQL